jgi:murein DD-endopeptidase MepM/ murein hydrolase activator NlpD
MSRKGRLVRRLSVGVILTGLVLLPRMLARRMEPPDGLAERLVEKLPPPLQVLNGTIARNSTLASSLQSSVPASTVHALVEAARPIYDLARVSVGHPFGLTLEHNGLLAAFTYGIDELRTLRVVREGERLKAELVSRTYDKRVITVAGTIESSLFGAFEKAGAASDGFAGARNSDAEFTSASRYDQLALDMADIFTWDVDFNTEVQRGDSFRVAVEALYLDGRFIRYGRILAAEFVNDGRRLEAVFFSGDSSEGYYRQDGKPLRRAFLRSPLKFTRISSGFSRSRFHPVLGKYRPHLGIDYAAPTGTPVHAAGDGVVTVAGWLGGYGQTVKLRHPNGYETLYGHLSRILVKRGQRVTQGMPIGRVGATGLATGPHLDYRMQRAGVYVNPLKIVSPAAEPVREAERARFDAAARAAWALLPAVSSSPIQVARAAP